MQKRGKNSSVADAEAFQANKKDILIFSGAGGTGYSFHADNTAQNQRKRIHYILQPGWQADKAVQGFGRLGPQSVKFLTLNLQPRIAMPRHFLLLIASNKNLQTSPRVKSCLSLCRIFRMLSIVKNNTHYCSCNN